jgi:hypothetical protein
MALSPLFQQLASIQDNFSLEPLLNPQKIANFGVDYDGDFLDSLNMMLERDANNSQSLKKFFCGHRGCGKSTLLYECAMSQEKWYFPVFFSIAAYRNLVVMGALEALVARPIILMPVLKLAPKGQRRSLPDDFTSPAIETLSKAIDRRLPDGFKQIIEPAVTRQLILASGGVFRELIRLVYGCLQIAQIQAYQNPDLVTLTIDEAIFLEAVKEIRIDLQAPLGERDYQILTQTYKDFKPNDPGDERFIQLLHRLCILEYKNDDLWYDIHPIIEDLLRRQKLIQSK